MMFLHSMDCESRTGVDGDGIDVIVLKNGYVVSIDEETVCVHKSVKHRDAGFMPEFISFKQVDLGLEGIEEPAEWTNDFK